MGQHCSFQLLAPLHSRLSHEFARTIDDEQLYSHYLDSMQRLRGRVYLKDNAIKPCDLDREGRFHMPADEQSWHLLLVDEAQEVIGCAKYLVHSSHVPYHRLRISHSAIAKDPSWAERVRRAVEADLKRVRDEKLAYVEVGGWALAEEWRGTRAALEILVGSFALGQIWGGALGSCTATVRHSSSSMLRRLGGASFELGGESLPSYNDPEYDCTMELLRFDYRTPAQRFLPLIDQLKTTLRKLPVLVAAQEAACVKLAAEYVPEQSRFLQLTPVFST
jgi:hypothetical protein